MTRPMDLTLDVNELRDKEILIEIKHNKKQEIKEEDYERDFKNQGWTKL